LLESHNLYPHCLSLELNLSAIDQGQFNLYVNLNFHEHWQSLLNGRIKFGLKGGRLTLKLDHAAIALAPPQFGEAFTITTQANPQQVHWQLALSTSQSVFKGSLEEINLGTVTITQEPVNLRGIFAVFLADISLTDAEGLWRHDISPNKHGILERKLAQFLWQTKLTPYLSWVQWGEEKTKSSTEWSEIPDKSGSGQDLAQLQYLINTVYLAKTNDFRELAQLAQLNPLTDLAGGNLLGAELSGVGLGGANLYHVNLRGADLTDADLSEANLKQAKLSGADLSGAYLGNATLTQANLHKASLALANLIRADLRGANLQEVNLSQANLSGARVEGAKFGDNPGMTTVLAESLRERGAEFIAQSNSD
jgi:uncharacterized protein YjbI with pentapeptide repeats